MEALFTAVIERLEIMHQHYFAHLAGLSVAELDWSPGPEMNSLCVLAVHVTAAERFWIGAAIDQPILRDRPAEFRAASYKLAALKARFTANINFCKEAFPSQRASRLGEIVDISLFRDRPPQQCTRGWALLHAVDHTAEHLGHAGMTRQLLERRALKPLRQKP